MTIENSAAGASPAAPQTSVQNPDPAANANDPSWLNKRLEQAKTNAEANVLKELGVSSLDEAKALAASAKAKADAEKSAEQRATEYKAQADQATAETARLAAATKEYAGRMMIGLSEEQKAAVTAIAGEDPAKQISAITALTPTWAKAAAATTSTVVTTAPPAHAPNGEVAPPANARAQYEAQRNDNPFTAAQFGLRNPSVYKPK